MEFDVMVSSTEDIFAVSDFTMSNPPQWDMKPTPVVNGFEVSGAPGIPIDSIEAGTQKVLVIKGEGFENIRDTGSVLFKNADAPGDLIKLEEYDYNVGASLSRQTNPGKYWTDTLIRVLVPTVSEDQEKNKYTAGTGDVIVQNAWAEDNTLQALWGFYKKS